MGDGLSAEEVEELAAVFADRLAAQQLLETVGLSRSRHPAWNAGAALQFWSEISHLLAAGVLERGRARILAEARRLFPANQIFATEVLVLHAEPRERQDDSRDGNSWVRDIKDLHEVREYLHPKVLMQFQRQILRTRFNFPDVQVGGDGEGDLDG